MEKYIRKLRESGYDDIVQVVKIKINNTAFFYDFGKELKTQILEKVDSSAFWIRKIEHYYDSKENLDILEIEVLKDNPGEVKVINKFQVNCNHFIRPYWKKIRKYIGNEQILSPGMSIVIKNTENKIAIVRRVDDGEWSLPAGAKEPGETIIETAKNEVFEETGLEIKDVKLVGVFSGSKMRWTYPNGHKMHFLSFLFSAGHCGGTLIVNDNENIEVRWVSPGEADALFNQRWKARLKMFLENKNEISLN
jgi:8-oxo-dGTP pyrophosphatase MutT (NUDIX family)